MPPLVCIIDDDLVSQFATQYRVKQTETNCKVISFDCAEMGLEMFADHIKNKKKLPDILLLDLVMPIMDGWEFLKEFEKIHKPDLPTDIYVLSAFTNSKDRKRAREHPMVKGYFDKPLTRLNIEEIMMNRSKEKLISSITQ